MSQEIPETPLEADRILQVLAKHGVEFVVIGDMAGLVHGSAYPTFDLDVVYSRAHSNLEPLAAALRELEVTLRGARADLPFQLDIRTLENGANFTFDSPYGKFDILADAAGMPAYEELRAEARTDEIEGVEVRVASIDHLIAMKRAAGRLKDKLMVEEYIVLADEQRRAGRDAE